VGYIEVFKSESLNKKLNKIIIILIIIIFMSLQSLINYRTQLKEEGASKAHLKNYDGEINQTMLTKSEEPDISLINYRLLRTQEGASSEEMAIIDSHIFKSFGTQPARFADIKIRTLTENTYVSVDLNRETVGDLYTRVAASLGRSYNMIKLIYKGKHLYNMDITLYELNLEKNPEIGVCFKLGCDGRGCCDRGYNMLCDSLLRCSESMINKLNEEEKNKFFNYISKISASEELDNMITQKKKELETLEKQIPPKLLCEVVGPSCESNLAALLSYSASSALLYKTGASELLYKTGPSLTNTTNIPEDEDLYS